MAVQDPTTELQSTQLWQYLNQIDQRYAGKAMAFLRGVAPVLATISDFFPYYTRHDAHHGFRVASRIAQIVHPDCFVPGNPKAFSGPEALLLIAAAYAHDLGMAVFPDEEVPLRAKFNLTGDDEWKRSARLTKYLRDHHSSRGQDFITEHADDLGVPRNLVTALGEMMRAHNLSTHQLEVELGRRYAAGEQEVDLKQLAIILCIADALEYSDTRVVDGVLQKLRDDNSPEALVSYRENMKHVCIGDSVAIGGDGRVIFSGSFTDPEVLTLSHKTIDVTEEWVRQYFDIESGATVKRLRIRGESFSRNLDLPGVDYERLGIRIKKDNIIDLISSHATWSSRPAVALRETLQNAVEACRYRRHNTPVAHQYEPRIFMTVNRNQRMITVEDNGCGMSKSVVLNNFLTVGNSRSREATYQAHQYTSLARFGIGFWSVFTVADTAEITTAPFEALAPGTPVDSPISGLKFGVSIDEFKDYTVFEPLERAPGTTVKLRLKPEIDIDSVLGDLSEQVICSVIPVTVVVEGEREFRIPERLAPLGPSELFGSRRSMAAANNVQVFTWQGEQDQVEVALTLAFREENGKATFLMPDRQNSLLRVLEGMNLPIAAVCGFTVPMRVGPLVLDIARVGSVSINIKDPKGMKFRLDRNSLLPSGEQESAVVTAAKLIHDGYRELLCKYNCYTPEDIYALCKQSRMHGGEVSDSYTEDTFGHAQANHADLVVFKLLPAESLETAADQAAAFVTLQELCDDPGRRFLTCQDFRSIRHLRAEGLVPDMYDLLAQLAPKGTSVSLVDPGEEASLLFDNCTEAEVRIAQFMGLQLYVLGMWGPLVPQRKGHPWVIGTVRGRWTGTLYERPILSADPRNQYVFLGRYRLVVKAGSRLARTFRELLSQGKVFAATELAVRLKNAADGHVDQTLREEWPELFEIPS